MGILLSSLYFYHYFNHFIIVYNLICFPYHLLSDFQILIYPTFKLIIIIHAFKLLDFKLRYYKYNY